MMEIIRAQQNVLLGSVSCIVQTTFRVIGGISGLLLHRALLGLLHAVFCLCLLSHSAAAQENSTFVPNTTDFTNSTNVTLDDGNTTESTTKTPKHDDGFSIFGLATIVSYALVGGVGALVLLIIIVVIAVCCWHCRNKKRKNLQKNKRPSSSSPLRSPDRSPPRSGSGHNLHKARRKSSQKQAVVVPQPPTEEACRQIQVTDTHDHKAAMMAKFLADSDVIARCRAGQDLDGADVINVIDDRPGAYADQEDFDSVSQRNMNEKEPPKMAQVPDQSAEVDTKKPIEKKKSKTPGISWSPDTSERKESYRKTLKDVVKPNLNYRMSTAAAVSNSFGRNSIEQEMELERLARLAKPTTGRTSVLSYLTCCCDCGRGNYSEPDKWDSRGLTAQDNWNPQAEIPPLALYPDSHEEERFAKNWPTAIKEEPKPAPTPAPMPAPNPAPDPTAKTQIVVVVADQNSEETESNASQSTASSESTSAWAEDSIANQKAKHADSDNSEADSEMDSVV